MWRGPARAPPGPPACELRASAALQAALKLQGGLASQIPPQSRSWERGVHEAAAPPAGRGRVVHLPLHCEVVSFLRSNFKVEV